MAEREVDHSLCTHLQDLCHVCSSTSASASTRSLVAASIRSDSQPQQRSGNCNLKGILLDEQNDKMFSRNASIISCTLQFDLLKNSKTRLLAVVPTCQSRRMIRNDRNSLNDI